MNNALEPIEKQIKERAVKSLKQTCLQITKNEERVFALEKELQSIVPAAGEEDSEDNVPVEVLQTRLEELDRDVKAKQMMFDHFLNNYQLEAELARIQKPSLRLLYRAAVPETPVYPKSSILILLGAVSALLLAWVLVIMGQKLLGNRRVDIAI